MSRPQSAVVLGTHQRKFINFLLYGHPGVGKTVLVGSGGAGVCILDADDGSESAEEQGSKATAFPCFTYDEFAELYEWLKHEALPKEEFNWVALDSGTLFQDRALMDDVMVDAHMANPEKQSRWVPSQREYLINMNRLGDAVRLLVALPVNVVITAHVMAALDDDGETEIYMPAFQGRQQGLPLASKVSGYMNVVGYLATNASGERRRLITQKTPTYYAKDRFHALRTKGKGYVDSPTLPKLEALVQAKRGAPTTPRRTRTRKAVAK